MSEDRKVGFVVTAENDTKRTFDEIKRDAQGMAQAVSKAGQDAGKGLSGVGDGAAPASQKVDRATRSMIQSIQRMTARMEAGSSANAKYWETLAQQRGVDPNALRPYLAQLEEVQRRQGLATAALGAGANEMNKYGLSAKQTAAAMRGVPAQLTDIFVSLQGGQRPMTVLLQQGGQLKDMFGGIVPAAQALGTTALKMVNPLMLVGGALVGLYAAYQAGSAEAENFNRTLILTGNAAGTSVDQLMTMAARIDGVVGTQRRAAAALNELANTTTVGARNFERFAETALRWEDATGTAASEVVKQLEEIGKSPVEAMNKLDRSMNFLTESTRKQIESLSEQGLQIEAARVLQNAYADALDERYPQMAEQLNVLGKLWRSIKKETAEAVDELNGIGRAPTLDEQLKIAEKQLREAQNFYNITGFDPTGKLDARRQRVADLQGEIALQTSMNSLMQDGIELQGIRLESEKNLASFVDARLTKDEQRTRDQNKEAEAYQARLAEQKRLLESGLVDETEYRQRIQRIEAAHQTALRDIRERYQDKGSGGINTTQAERARLLAAVEAEKQRETQLHASAGALANLNEHEKAAIQYGEKIKLVTDGKTKAQLLENKALAEEAGARKRANDAFDKELKERESAIDAAQKQTLALRDQIETYGMGKSAIEAMTIARLEERIAMADPAVSEAQIDSLKRELAARRELYDAMRTKEALDAQLKEWQAWEKEVDRIFDQLGQSLTDQLFEGGVNARDLLKDLFKNMVFRVAVQPVMGAMQGWVTNQLGGMFGYQNPQQQGGGGILGLAQHASSLHSAFTGGLTDTMAGGINWLGEQFGSSALKSFAAGMTGTAAVASTSLGAATMVPGLGVGVAGGAAATGGVISGTAGLIPGLGVGAGGGAAAAGGVASGAAASGAAGAGAAFAAAAPWIAGGLAVAGLLGSDLFGSSDTRFGGSYVYDRRTGRAAHDGGWQSGNPGDEFGSQVNALVESTAAAINAAFQGVGSQVYVDRLFGELESSEKGRGGVASGGWLVNLPGGMSAADVAAFNAVAPVRHHAPDEGGVRFGTANRGQGHGSRTGSLEEMYANLQTDLVQGVIQAWQHGINEFPVIVQDMIRGIDADSLSLEKASAVVQQVQAVIGQAQAFQAAVEQLPFENLKGLAFDAAAGLIAAAGGLENLNAGMTSYYQTYYSDAEQLDRLSQQISASFAGIGMEMPDVTQGAEAAKQAFRALFESIDPTTEAGQQAAAMMLSVNQSFAQLVTGLEELEGAAAEVGNAGRTLADITRERESLERQWLQINGNTAELRRRDLEALDESNRALQRLIWARQDEAQAAQDAAAAWQQAQADLGTALGVLRQQAHAEITRLQQSFAGTDAVYRAVQTAVQGIERELQGVFDSLGRHIRDLRGEVDSTARMQYEQARAVISTALVTGQLPQTVDLNNALQAARDGVAGQMYASLVDQERAYVRLANEMEQLQAIAEPELDTARKTLREAERQYNALRGIADTSSSSLDVLLGQLSVAIAAEESARIQIAGIESQLAWAQAQHDALLGIKAGVDGFPAALQSFASALSAAQAAQVSAGSGGSYGGGAAPSNDAYYEAKLAQLKSTGSTHDGINWSYATTDDLKAYFGNLGLTPLEHWEKWGGKNEGLPRPSFAVGTNYVPYDMTADIHRGERIIPAADNRALMQALQGGADRELVAEVRALREQNAQLRHELVAIKRATEQLADQIDQVTEGGNAMRGVIMEPVEVATA